MNDFTKEELNNLKLARYELDKLIVYMHQKGDDWQEIVDGLERIEKYLYPNDENDNE